MDSHPNSQGLVVGSSQLQDPLISKTVHGSSTLRSKYILNEYSALINACLCRSHPDSLNHWYISGWQTGGKNKAQGVSEQ